LLLPLLLLLLPARSPTPPLLGLQNPEPSPAQKIVAFKEAFWKFLRPHTIRGTILGSTAVTSIALLENSGVGRPHSCSGRQLQGLVSCGVTRWCTMLG
jgi:hypothetical protein